MAAKHFRQIDGIRCFAALSVVVIHFFPPKIYPWSPLFLGVTRLFFVMAGYLAVMILMKNFRRAQDEGVPRWNVLGRYYLRRFSRLFPLLACATGLIVIAGVTNARQTWPWHLLAASNLYYMTGGEEPWLMFHMWYLGVQEQCLLALTLMMLITPLRAMPLLLAAGCVVGIATRGVFVWMGEPGKLLLDHWPTGSMDMICAGGFLAWFQITKPAVSSSMRNAWRVVVAVSLAVVVYSRIGFMRDYTPPLGQVIFPALASPFYVWLVHAASVGFKGPVGFVLSNRVVVYLGVIGYGIYVYHNFIARVVGNLLAEVGYPLEYLVTLALGWSGWQPSIERGSGFTIVLWFVVSVIVASISYHLIEKPIASIKRYVPSLPQRCTKAPPREPPTGEDKSA